MKIFGICLVKDEADMIRETLVKALSWCDYIFIYDNGSEDGTWEIAQELASQFKQIVAYKKLRQPFDDSLRSDVFNEYKHLAQDGDWWCRLDADEIYIDDPKSFLARVNRWHHVVHSEHYQFYFTEKDLEIWKSDPAAYDTCSDYENRLNYYKCNASEARFIKHRNKLVWERGSSWPKHLGIVSPLRIRVKHYQYRSPGQIEHRLKMRKLAIAEGYLPFQSYNRESHWQQKVVNSNDCHVCEGGLFVKDETLLPRHLEPLHKRFLKYVFHGLGVFP